jgi:hypothetical protein
MSLRDSSGGLQTNTGTASSTTAATTATATAAAVATHSPPTAKAASTTAPPTAAAKPAVASGWRKLGSSDEGRLNLSGLYTYTSVYLHVSDSLFRYLLLVTVVPHQKAKADQVPASSSSSGPTPTAATAVADPKVQKYQQIQQIAGIRSTSNVPAGGDHTTTTTANAPPTTAAAVGMFYMYIAAACVHSTITSGF